jgi:Uma2 family endonuclease
VPATKSKEAIVATSTIVRKRPGIAQRHRNGAVVGTTLFSELGEVKIPAWVRDLASFRRWAHTTEFPEKIRVCFLQGEVWVDMSQEQIFTHNQVKNEYSFVLTGLTKVSRLGRFFPDGILLTNEDANLSCSPDGTYVLQESFDSNRIRLVEGKKGGYVELEGTADMVLEIVSDSSEKKDLLTQRELYWKAGIAEYWLVDVRGESDVFEIYRHAAKGYVATRKQEGWIKSSVFSKAFRLLRRQDERGNPEYSLEVK